MERKSKIKTKQENKGEGNKGVTGRTLVTKAALNQ